MRLLRDGRNQPIRDVLPVHARELLANDPVFALQRVEHCRHARDDIGRSQEPQRMTCRGGIDDDQIVGRARS